MVGGRQNRNECNTQAKIHLETCLPKRDQLVILLFSLFPEENPEPVAASKFFLRLHLQTGNENEST